MYAVAPVGWRTSRTACANGYSGAAPDRPCCAAMRRAM